jgi:hypothetical protein
MTATVAKYTFSSWLRKGIGTKISETDNLGAGSSPTKERPTVPVEVTINTLTVHKNFSLLGPGDIIGINPAMVVRTEPKHLITNFEPNYLAFIEYYDEEFAWRYSPAKANDRKLRPWIALIVLKEDEFTADTKTFPLPSITVSKPGILPPSTDTWAWAHVHINDSYESSSAFEQFLNSLHDPNAPNQDKIICRLMCPRKLDPNTRYHAFVVPTFETGRKAGLSEDISQIDAQRPAWDAASANLRLPYYYEWYFATGVSEDFESLIRLLEPRIIDKRVGIRHIDGSKPGFGMVNGTDIGTPDLDDPPSDPNIIGLEGALKAPTTKSRPPNIDVTRPFFPELQAILNFREEIKKTSNTVIDPLVGPPIYGENHALLHEIDVTRNGWIHVLNKDPRNRVPAGLGTSVIQKNQVDYMARAWQQVQRILEANRLALFASFSLYFAEAVKKNFISKLDSRKAVVFFSPLLKKIKGSPTTLHQQMLDSAVPPASVSPAFRRLIRPRGAYFRKLSAVDPAFTHGSLLKDLNDGRVSAAPPKQVPGGILTDTALAEGMLGTTGLQWLIRYRFWILLLLLLLAILLAFAGLFILAVAVAALAIGAFAYLRNRASQADAAQALKTPEGAAQAFEGAPPKPGFTFTETDSAVPSPPIAPSSGTTVTTSTERSSSAANATVFTTVAYHTPGAAGVDSLEARNFRAASIALNNRLNIKAPVKTPIRFDFDNALAKINDAVDPKIVFPRQLAHRVNFSFNPDWLLHFEHLVPAMAYPDFEDPMYEQLRKPPDLLIPNLNLIPHNTISLLVTNPAFIESYMVGLNHEFGKELLWREYPTDTRGSYFRQFWDVKGIITNDSNKSKEELANEWKDITPLDKWGTLSTLGAHNRQHGKQSLVLVIRGELLKKYPSTIIYAQKAHIHKDPVTGAVDGTKDPVIIEVQTEADMKAEIKFPLFKADIDPDYKFFGFDLTKEQARGADHPAQENDDWGYFFVIQQIPGEPRFGMDIAFEHEDAATPVTWDDMAWDRYPAKTFIETTVKPLAIVPAGGDSLGQWGADSASMAYILYQKPVMVAIHAREMLEQLD